MNATTVIRRREDGIAAALLALIVAATFAPWLFTGKTLYWGDIGLFFLPLGEFLKQNLAHGKIPLWNPDLFCGAPYVGNPQVSPLYPMTSPLLALVPAPTGIMISLALHIFGAGMVFFWLIRAQSPKIALLPTALGASVYMLGGYFVGKAQFPNMLESLAYVPLILLLTRRIVEKPGPVSIVTFGLAFGLQLLAAHTQICVLTCYLTLAYGLWLYFGLEPRPRLASVIAAAFGAGLLGVALSCCYWLPTAELVRAAARQTLTLHDANRFHLLPYQWTNFVLPHRYGTPMSGNWRAAGNYWETACYVGLIPAALVIFASVRSVRRLTPGLRADRFWAVMFVMGTWLALGQWGGLYDLAFWIVPGLKAFHDPGRFLIGPALAAGMLAASGADGLLSRIGAPRVRLAAGAALLVLSVLDLGWQARGMYPVKPMADIAAMADAPIPTALRTESLRLNGAGRELMPDSPRSWHEFTTYRRYSQSDPAFLAQWADTVTPCLNLRFGLREMGGYDPETRRDSQAFITRGEGYIGFDAVEYGHAKPVVPLGYAAFLGMLSVRNVVTFRVKPLDVDDLALSQTGTWTRDHKQVRVYENTAYQPRARCYRDWTVAQDQTDALRMLDQEMAASSHPDFVNRAILESPGINQAILDAHVEGDNFFIPTAGASVEKLVIAADEPDRVSIRVPDERKARFVVLSDTFHPGWTATLDGQPTTVFRANVAQRAVFIPKDAPGTHTVTFEYRPVDFLFGLYVSLLTMTFFAAFGFAALTRQALRNKTTIDSRAGSNSEKRTIVGLR